MPLNSSYKELNRASVERIKKLASLTDKQLQTRVGEHWTASIVLAHIAFWEKRVMYVLEISEKNGRLTFPEIDLVVNDLSLPLWAAIPPREALRIAIESCEEVDKRLETYPQKLLEEVYGKYERWVFRSLHRDEHLDEIDAALKGK